MMCIKMKTIIPDTSAVIIGAISQILEKEDFAIIPETKYEDGTESSYHVENEVLKR